MWTKNMEMGSDVSRTGGCFPDFQRPVAAGTHDELASVGAGYGLGREGAGVDTARVPAQGALLLTCQDERHSRPHFDSVLWHPKQ